MQSASATALVNIYAATTANVDKAAAIGGLYTTTVAATSNLATQPAQSTSMTFVAPASTVYIVYAKNTTATNFNFFIDNLVLTETKPSVLNEIEMNSSFKSYVSGNKISIDFELINSSFVDFIVSNIHGQVLFSQKLNYGQGINHKVIDIDLPTGVYLVKISVNGLSSTHKVVK